MRKILQTISLCFAITNVSFSQLAWVQKAPPNVGGGIKIACSRTGVVYAAGRTGVAMSVDGGGSWVNVNDPTWANATCWALAFSDANDLYVSIGGSLSAPGSLWKQTPGGWVKCAIVGTTQRYFTSLCPGANGTVLACDGVGDILRTSDATTFTRIVPNLNYPSPGGSPWCMARDRAGNIWIGGEWSTGVYKSTDNGNTFTSAGLASPPWNYNVSTFDFTLSGNEPMSDKSGDGGLHYIERQIAGVWTTIGTGMASYQRVSIIKVHPVTGVVYAGTWYGPSGSRVGDVWASTDNGATFHKESAGLPQAGILWMDTDPVTGDLYLINEAGAVYKSPAGAGSGPPPLPVLASLYFVPNTIFATAGDQAQLVIKGKDQNGADFPIDQQAVTLTWDQSFMSVALSDWVTFSKKVGNTQIHAQLGAAGGDCYIVLQSTPPTGVPQSTFDSLKATYDALVKALQSLPGFPGFVWAAP